MDRELIIKLALDRSGAEASSQAFHQGEKARVANLLSDAEVAERARSQVIDRENKARVQAAVAAATAQQQATARVLSDAEVAEAARTQLVERENQKRVAAAVRGMQAEQDRLSRSLSDSEAAERARSQLIERENARRVADQLRGMQSEAERVGRSLTDAEVAEAAKTQAVERENQKRIAEAARALQSEADRLGRSLTDAEAVEQAKSQLVQRENQRRVAEQLRAMQSADDRVARSLTAEEVAEQAKSQVVQKENQRRVAEATRAATSEEQLLTKNLTKEEVAFRVRDQLVQRSNQRRVEAAVKAAEVEQGGWGLTTAGIQGAFKALTSFAGQMVGLSSAQAVVSAFFDEFERGRLALFKSVDLVEEYREALLELSALKGNIGAGGTTATLASDLAFRARTLQTQQQSRAFQEASLGVGQAAIGVQITPQEFARLQELAGAFQAAEGGSAETHGRLAGQIPTLIGRQTTAAEAFAREQQLYNIFQPGGASFTSLTGQYLKNAPLVTSGVYGKEGMGQMAALLSAFSVTNPEGAGENVQQFTRATVAALGRMRGVQVTGESEKQAEYLQRLGATDQLSPIEIGKLIATDLAKQERAAADKGEKFNAYSYLQHKGYGSVEDINALLSFSGLMKTGQFEQTFEPLAAKVPTPEEAVEKVEKAQRTEPVLQARRSELAEQMANIAAGAGDAEYLESLRKLAFARRRARGEETYASYEEMRTGTGSWHPNKMFDEFLFQHKARTDVETQRMLEEEATRVGVAFERPTTVDTKTGQVKETPGYAGDQYVLDLAKRVRAAGGEDMPGIGVVQERAIGKLEEIRDAVRRLDKPQQPIPAPHAAPEPPKGAVPPVPEPPRAAPGPQASIEPQASIPGFGLREAITTSLIGAMSGEVPGPTIRPTVEVPEVPEPASKEFMIPAPTVRMPELRPIRHPGVEMPEIEVPEVPPIPMPEIDRENLRFPVPEMPEVRHPGVDVPVRVTRPTLPDVDLPEVEWPSTVGLPTPEEMGANRLPPPPPPEDRGAFGGAAGKGADVRGVEKRLDRLIGLMERMLTQPATAGLPPALGSRRKDTGGGWRAGG